MSANLEQFQKFGKEQMEAVQSATSEFAKGLQSIAAEAADYSKKSVESGSAFVEKLVGVKTLDEAIKLQADFAKASFENIIAQSTKIGELYSNLAKTAYKPLEGVIAKVQAK